MSVGNPNTADVHLFLENEPLLDNEDFFDNRDDRNVSLFANRRHSVDRPANGNILDFDALMRERLVNKLLCLTRDGRNANRIAFYPSPSDSYLLCVQAQRSTDSRCVRF